MRMTMFVEAEMFTDACRSEIILLMDIINEKFLILREVEESFHVYFIKVFLILGLLTNFPFTSFLRQFKLYLVVA